MEEELEVDGSGVLRVLNTEMDIQVVLGEGDGIRQRSRIIPFLLIFSRQLRRVERECEHGGGTIVLLLVPGIYPGAVPRKAVRWKRRSLMILWR